MLIHFIFIVSFKIQTGRRKQFYQNNKFPETSIYELLSLVLLLFLMSNACALFSLWQLGIVRFILTLWGCMGPLSDYSIPVVTKDALSVVFPYPFPYTQVMGRLGGDTRSIGGIYVRLPLQLYCNISLYSSARRRGRSLHKGVYYNFFYFPCNKDYINQTHCFDYNSH